MEDLFVRRVYTHKRISVCVEIDFVKGTVTMVERTPEGGWKPKPWIFAGRTPEYTKGWLDIMDAMKYATKEAFKVIDIRREEKVINYGKLLMSLDKKLK